MVPALAKIFLHYFTAADPNDSLRYHHRNRLRAASLCAGLYHDRRRSAELNDVHGALYIQERIRVQPGRFRRDRVRNSFGDECDVGHPNLLVFQILGELLD